MSQSGRRLLVIDDDTIVRQSIAAYLEDSGFLVHQEADGHSALTWLMDNPPCLVLTDLRMPGTDGLTLLKAIREWDVELPVIVISGAGAVQDVAEALRHGASDYLVKPIVDMEVLVHSIRRSLERHDLIIENRQYRVELERANKDLKEYIRVLERDQQAGRRVQGKLLPPPNVCFGGINVDYKIIPSLYLSGDFVDYGYLSNRYLAFYLTDVSGHGAASAFVTVWLKQIVRRFFREQEIFNSKDSFERDTASLLKLINKEVIRSKVGAHMTCFVGVIDTHTHEMRYVVAGHLPLPLLIANGRAEYLEGKGKPLGIFEDAEWEVQSIQLPAQQQFSLVVFSDGVLEVLPPDNLIEKENYLRNVLSKQEGSIEDICAALQINSLDAAPDDIAVLKIDNEMLK